MTYLNRAVTLIFLIVFSAHAFSAEKIETVNMPIPSNLDGSRPAQEEIQKAILWACKKRGWSPVVIDQQNIEASILVRSKHFVKVNISYDEESYTITYIESRNLKYNAKKGTIHRSYNKWANMLSQSIQRGFEVKAQMF